jgi:drug/metabolite transporter (DMT)-like permease
MMRGWKTWLGSIIIIGAGIYLIVTGQADIGAPLIGQGLAVIGIGHKIEKAFGREE